MAVTGLGRTETCIVHHDRPAAARCGRCHKPICEECVISTADGKFCSRECAAKTADFRKANAGRKRGPGIVSKFVRLVVWIVIIVVALGAINKFIFNNRMKVLGPYLNKIPMLGPEQGSETPSSAPQPEAPGPGPTP